MDMRVYDGCPSDELQEYLEKIQEYENAMKARFPESHVTYFPMEGEYAVYSWGKALSTMHDSKLNAILEVLGE